MLTLWTTLETGEWALAARGPMNVGHDALACGDCHREAAGSVRQQLQAKVHYWLGGRQSDTVIGRTSVTNEACTECHARREERHPPYRFFEPRFDDARQALDVEHCVACHEEHTGRRVTRELTFCRHCHQDTSLKKDPVSPSHASLIHDARWETCLGCHDFHGNHVMTEETDVTRAIAPEPLRRYFDGAKSPYPEHKHDPAKKKGGAR